MHDLNSNIYFAPILPWQTNQWEQLTARYERLPHGLLFAGMEGLGKRAFVWRYVAWLLCNNRALHADTACGDCQSCQWLAVGTHPDLKVLPQSSLPFNDDEKDKATTKKTKKSSKASNTSNAQKTEDKKPSIKIDDIRELLPFISQGSTGRRVCVIDNADMMTVAAANALLKTLEEPRQGVHLFLISDNPTKLLPTIRSRVQKVAIDQVSSTGIHSYLSHYINNNTDSASFNTIKNDPYALDEHINQALKLANGAPLAALLMLNSTWYQHRAIWLKTWLALRTNKRSSIAASDYWQTLLTLNEFIVLTEIMLMDMSRYSLGLHPLQLDLKFEDYDSIKQLDLNAIQQVMSVIDNIKLSIQQNVQDKLGYDRLMSSLQSL